MNEASKLRIVLTRSQASLLRPNDGESLLSAPHVLEQVYDDHDGHDAECNEAGDLPDLDHVAAAVGGVHCGAVFDVVVVCVSEM